MNCDNVNWANGSLIVWQPSNCLFWCVISLCLMPGCIKVVSPGANAVPGSGVRTTAPREFEPFHAVEFDGRGELRITVGGQQSVKLEIDDNLMELITTQVRDGRLLIGSKKPYHSTQGLIATITVPELNFAGLDGSGDIFVEGIGTNDLEARVSGAGDMHLAGIDNVNLNISIAGSGEVHGNGTAESVTVHLAGSGDVDLSEVLAKDVKIDIAGSGNARVHATEKLEVSVAGSGNVRFQGDPVVEKSIFGSGDVRKE